MAAIYGIKNLTGAELNLGDLGLIVDASATVTLSSVYLPDQLRGSAAVLSAVQNDLAIIIDNGNELNKATSLLFLAGAMLSPESISVSTVSGSNIVVTGTVTAGYGTFSLGLTVSGLPVSIGYDYGDNLLINGGFQVNQRMGTQGTYTNSSTWLNTDDRYTVDRWNLLSNGNNIVNVTRTITGAPVGSYSILSFAVATANTKFGVAQYLEQSHGAPTKGGPVSLQLKLSRRNTASITKVRAAIIGCSSSPDTITSDIVSAWNTEGTNPTLIGTWTYLNTPVDLLVGATDADYQLNKIENVQVSATAFNNIGVFIWSENTTTTVGHLLGVADLKLEIGARCTPYRERPYTTELQLCQRYFCKTQPQSAAAQDNAGTSSCLSVHSPSNTANDVRAIWRFPVEMRTTPTIATYNPTAGTASAWDRAGTGVAATTFGGGTSGVTIVNSAATTTDLDHNIHASADAEL